MERYDLTVVEDAGRLYELLHDGHLDLADDLRSARGTVVLTGCSGAGPVVDVRKRWFVTRGTIEKPRLALTVRGVTDVELDDGARIGTTLVDQVAHRDGWVVVGGVLPVDLRLRTDDPVVEVTWTGEVERVAWSRLGRWQSGGWERPG